MNRVFVCELTRREQELMALAWDDLQFEDLFPKDVPAGSEGSRFELTPDQIYADILKAVKEKNLKT